MSLSIASTSAVAPAVAIKSTATSATGGGALPFSTGTTASGAYMAQGAGAPSDGGSLVKKLAVGVLGGAGLALGATFLIPGLREITMFGVGGWAAKGIIAAIGGAVGAVGALAVHFIGKKKAQLNMEAQAAAQQQAAAAAVPPVTGGTLKVGSRGAAAKKIQTELKTLGIYDGPINGTFDSATATAVRKYEVLKGANPTGLGSPDVRAAVTQDAGLIRTYV